MKQRLYLDTSVISLLDDDRYPERRDLTREFWLRRADYEVCSSEVARREIMDTPDPARRDSMLAVLNALPLLSVTSEAERLASAYIATGVFPPGVADDALHVAVAVLARQDILVSWNFKHLVNQRRRAMIDSLNLSRSLPPLRILSPPEV